MWRERGRRVTGAKSLSGLLRLAGNGDFAACSPVQRSVCPRSRGEQHLTRCGRKSSRGLSPLARFIPARAVYPRSRGLSPLARFIPARAGNRPLNLRIALLCGGLSPLARGTVTVPAFRSTSSRFIPARAGNRAAADCAAAAAAVYPRSRGEQEGEKNAN